MVRQSKPRRWVAPTCILVATAEEIYCRIQSIVYGHAHSVDELSGDGAADKR